MIIKEMTISDLIEAMDFMAKVPQNDPTFSGWNFDKSEWEEKYIELIDEMAIKRKLEGEE